MNKVQIIFLKKERKRKGTGFMFYAKHTQKFKSFNILFLGKICT